jgi:hypothetical protein
MNCDNCGDQIDVNQKPNTVIDLDVVTGNRTSMCVKCFMRGKVCMLCRRTALIDYTITISSEIDNDLLYACSSRCAKRIIAESKVIASCDIQIIRSCKNCGKKQEKLKTCSKCGTHYCDKECQAADWSHHKNFCKNR